MFRLATQLPTVLLSVALATGMLVASPGAQRRRVATDDVFRSGIELVQMAATVVDAEGRLVGDLRREDFEVYENGERQTLTHFTRDRVPLSVGVVLDISQSMYGQRIDDARLALDRFLADLLDPEDEVFIIVFNHTPRVAVPWTLGPRGLRNRLDDIRPYGGTSIYDAMMEALPLFDAREHQRAAVVLVSDGSDTGSDADIRDVRRQLRRSDAFVYAIAIDAPDTRPINDRVNPFALREMTTESGGYTEVVHDSPELGPATARIADELNHQYTLSYMPSHPPDGSYRSIRVRIAGSEHRVRTRRGYVAEPSRRR
ncbi:MAG: VWA domain-containing protein [Vicinamibacterales bacterium]|jgi:VWFA-related protein|nr:VWA domain-containing protein [Vicinamibacterales bacterium]